MAKGHRSKDSGGFATLAHISTKKPGKSRSVQKVSVGVGACGASPHGQDTKSTFFRFMDLSFDLAETILQYLPAREMGRFCAVCRKMDVIYQGAISSIFADIVKRARGRSRLKRAAELALLHRLRHTHDSAENAIEMSLWGCFNGYDEYVIGLVKSCGSITVDTPGSEEWVGANMLHVACRRGNLGLVKSLLGMGADPSLATRQGRTPLILAAENGYEDIVRYLLDSYAEKLDVNACDALGRTALFAACESGKYPVVVSLLEWAKHLQLDQGLEEFPLDVNLGTVELGSPLCVACKTGYTKVVSILLDHKCHVNTTTQDKRSALFVAVERGAVNTTKILLNKRPPVNGKQQLEFFLEKNPHKDMEEAVAFANSSTEIPAVDPVEAGVLVDFANDSGKTPLFVAAERGNAVLVTILLDAGVEVSKPTFLNKTPLYAAAENGHREVVRLLLARSTRKEVMHQTNFGTTALFMAKRNGYQAVHELLTDFCVSEMSMEKAQRRKDKKKQSEYMQRLTAQKKKRLMQKAKRNKKPKTGGLKKYNEEEVDKALNDSKNFVSLIATSLSAIECQLASKPKSTSNQHTACHKPK